MCTCEAAKRRTFVSVETAVNRWQEIDAILAGCDELLRLDEKWMCLYRCRACGTLWVEATQTAGMMDIRHLFPAPAVDDPAKWIRDEGDALPFERRRT